MHTRIGESRKQTLLYRGKHFLEVGAPQAAIHSIIPSMLDRDDARELSLSRIASRSKRPRASSSVKRATDLNENATNRSVLPVVQLMSSETPAIIVPSGKAICSR